MDQTKVKAIVISAIDYKEKDKLVTLFSLEQGIITVVFKSVKKPNAKLKSAKELFTFGDFIFTSSAFNVVTAVDVVSSFYNITKNIKSYYVACNILKIIKTVLPVGEVSTSLFLDTIKCLSLLDEQNVNPIIVLNKFLVRVFEGFGYRFNLNACNNCGSKFLNYRYMNLQYGDITCQSCKLGVVEEISNAQYSVLRLLSNTDYSNLHTVKTPKGIDEKVFNLLSKNFYHRFNVKLEEIF